MQILGHFEGFRAARRALRLHKERSAQRAAELIAQKKGLFLAFLGLFLQTKGSFEEQKEVVK